MNDVFIEDRDCNINSPESTRKKHLIKIHELISLKLIGRFNILKRGFTKRESTSIYILQNSFFAL